MGQMGYTHKNIDLSDGNGLAFTHHTAADLGFEWQGGAISGSPISLPGRFESHRR